MSQPSAPKPYRLPLLIALTVVLGGVAAGAAAFLVSPSSPLRQSGGSGTFPSFSPPTAPVELALAPAGLFEGSRPAAVLMYHDVVKSGKDVSFDVTRAELKQQLQQLKKVGANVIPLADLYDHLRTGKELPEKAVVLTFDDGYLGQWENAYPLLKKFGYPATYFVHTGVVGVKTSKDHMTWEQLQTLEKEGLVSVECHTVTHPDDLRKVSDTQLDRELNESKKVLEEKLGRKIRFLAYPVGNADSRVAKVAHDAGYELAFTMGPGWAGSPADAFFVPRFGFHRLRDVVAGLEATAPTFVAQSQVLDIVPSDLEMGSLDDEACMVRWICGGRMAGLRLIGRQDVPTIIKAAKAAAGLNGTFFSDARVNSAGAGVVGPILNRFGPPFAPGLPGDRERIAGRPLVVISREKMAFLPFRPELAFDPAGVERLIPGATDCFVGGAWLVHQGRALTHAEMESFRLSNIFDFRPRAFMGIDSQGRPFLGASSTGNQSDRLAQTLEKIGVRECVLLDSGFSTSLTVGQQVLVTGLMRKDIPARPVPHALLLYPYDPETKSERPVIEWGLDDLKLLAVAPDAQVSPDAGAAPVNGGSQDAGPDLGNAPAAVNAPLANAPAADTPASNAPSVNAPGNGPVPGANGPKEQTAKRLTMEELQVYLKDGLKSWPGHGDYDPATAGRRHRRRRHRRR